MFVLLSLVTYVRWIQPTPRCVNDEVRYTEIVDAKVRGVVLPISGPGYVWLVSKVSSTANVATPQAVALVGWLGAALLLGTLACVLRNTVPPLALPAIAAIMCTSYFWAGISESRPQLFGYSALLMASWLLSQLARSDATNPRVTLGLLALSALTAMFHILTFFMFGCLCAATLVAIQMKRNVVARTRISRTLVTTVTVGAAIILFPGGPYSAMISDIVTAHLINPMLILGVCVGAVTIGSMPLGLVRRGGWAHAERLTTQCSSLNSDRAAMLIAAAAVALFSVQAALLPNEYWLVYNRSLLRFVASQWGNIMYAVLFLLGARTCFNLIRDGKLDQGMIVFLAATLVMALVSAAFLVISLGLLNTNWMLRAVDYAVMFGGPVAAYGVMHLWRRNPVATLILLSTGMSAGVMAGTKSSLFFVSC